MNTLSRASVAIMMGVVTALASVAQEAPVPVPAKPVPAPAAPAPPLPRIDTLAAALEHVPWDPEPRGPLLVVDPKNTRKWMPRPAPGMPPEVRYQATVLAPPPPGGYRLAVVAPYFGRKIVRLDTLSVLAPTQMTVLNTRPGKGDPLASMRRDEKVRLFAGSLNVAQWKQLAGPQGLGAGDLAPEQRAFFLSLLPEPFRVHKMTVASNAGGSYGAGSPITLSSSQKAQVRLRINRSVEIMFPAANGQRMYYGIGRPARRPVGEEHYTLSYSGEAQRSDAYGVTLRADIPNRLKPGHLTFDAPTLQAAVSLEGGDMPSTAPAPPPPPTLTVKELLKRVEKATRVELYADPRVANLPVWTAGKSARAGDILKALCYAVTGTFRKVGPVFVLTDDVMGIGTRRALLSDWGQDVGAQGQKLRADLDKRIQEIQPGQFMDFAPDDPLAVDAATLKKMDERRRAMRQQYTPDADSIPVADLPPAFQQQLTAFLAERQGDHMKNARTDRVRLDVQARMSYLVPEIGDIEDANLHLYNIPALPMPPPQTPPPAPPVVIPPTMAARALYIAPASAEEAERAAGEARRLGITHLWVETPEGGKGKGLLASAVKAGKAHKLFVFGVVRLLHRRPAPTEDKSETLPAESRDINILGLSGFAYARQRLHSTAGQASPWTRDTLIRSGDWLRPDAPSTAALLKKQLLDLAATPGLTGLVLRDTAAPGYADPGVSNQNYSFGDSKDFGYSLEARLQFLRQESMDPVDLISANSYVGGADLNLPFFSDHALQPRMIQVENRWTQDPAFKSPVQQWKAFRHKQNARLLAELHAAVKTAHPNLALVIGSRADDRFGEPWYGTWDKPDALPFRSPYVNEGNPPTLAQTARSFSRRILISIPYRTPSVPDPKYSPREAFTRTLGYSLERNKTGWDGIVFDLSDVPVERALPLLEALNPPAPNVAATRKEEPAPPTLLR